MLTRAFLYKSQARIFYGFIEQWGGGGGGGGVDVRASNALYQFRRLIYILFIGLGKQDNARLLNARCHKVSYRDCRREPRRTILLAAMAITRRTHSPEP
jgi:hypothetical protein